MASDTTPIPQDQSNFGERYEVNAKSPLAEFSTPGGNAYAVVDKNNTDASLYALVQHNGVPSRDDVFKALKGANIGGLICPVDRGVMNVTLEGRQKQRLVTIFERPAGGALIAPDGTPNPRLSPILIKKNVTLGLLKVVASLHRKGIPHRHILPTRLYLAAPASDEILVGECCSTPAGFKVPMGAEPLDLAFADDSARGLANESADFYQIGVTLQCLAFGKLLYNNRERDTFLTARVNQSSFWALAGGQDIAGTLGNLVRGLMADEVDERWHAEEMVNWFEGITSSRRTTMKAWSLSRPTVFEGTSYADRRLLAEAFAKSPEKAAAFIRSLEFDKWIQSSLRDEILTEKLERALSLATDGNAGTNRNQDMRMVSRVCMFLHPTGPVRYRTLSLNPDAIPVALTAAFADGRQETVRAILELFDLKLLTNLIDIAGAENPAMVNAFAATQKLIETAKSSNLGKGMERALYELNPSLPCLSTRLENVYIASMSQLMHALDRLSGKGGGKNILFDRHVAAFCAKHGGDLDREFNRLAAAQQDPARFNILAANFFGVMQKRYKIEKLPALTKRLVDNLKPALRELKDKKRREQVEKLLDKVQKTGDISKMTSTVDLTKIQAQDRREFAAAVTEVRRLDREKQRLSRKITYLDPEAQFKGLKAARNVAGLGALAMALVMFM